MSDEKSFHKAIRDFIATRIPPSEKTKALLRPLVGDAGLGADHPPRELHTDDKAIILAVGARAFGAGLLGFYENHKVLGTVYIVGSLIVMAPISPFIRSRVHLAFGPG